METFSEPMQVIPSGADIAWSGLVALIIVLFLMVFSFASGMWYAQADIARIRCGASVPCIESK